MFCCGESTQLLVSGQAPHKIQKEKNERDCFLPRIKNCSDLTTAQASTHTSIKQRQVSKPSPAEVMTKQMYITDYSAGQNSLLAFPMNSFDQRLTLPSLSRVNESRPDRTRTMLRDTIASVLALINEDDFVFDAVHPVNHATDRQ